jgi:hypothetical protein
MDLLHTLLSFIGSSAMGLVLAVHALFGGFLADEQKITILPPPTVEATLHATTSSQTIIGSSTPPAPKTIKPAVKPKTTTATPLPIPQTPPTPTISADDLNTQTRAALVNILCYSKGGGVHSISGSGIFVDGRGIILTNAHVGQYFLLKDYPTTGNVDCTIRTGGPAQPRYHATLLYLPPAWITDNAAQIIAQQSKGTGEHDYAFLLVTDAIGTQELPSTFPHLPMVVATPEVGDSEFLAGYPAGFLDGITIEKNLYPTTAYTTVKDIYTFNDPHHVDLAAISGTIVSQGGSSGGAMVRAFDGKLQGLISISTTGDTTASRDLWAITLEHIDRSLAAQGEKGLSALLSQDATEAAARFASSTAPGEKQVLVKTIEHH